MMLLGSVITLGLAVPWYAKQLSSLRNDIRNAHNQVMYFDSLKRASAESDLQHTRSCLYQLAVLHNPTNFIRVRSSPMEFFLERERTRAVADVVTILRQRSPEDLGDDPSAWTGYEQELTNRGSE